MSTHSESIVVASATDIVRGVVAPVFKLYMLIVKFVVFVTYMRPTGDIAILEHPASVYSVGMVGIDGTVVVGGAVVVGPAVVVGGVGSSIIGLDSSETTVLKFTLYLVATLILG